MNAYQSILEGAGLRGIRKGLRNMQKDFSEGLFFPYSYYGIFRYQNFFRGVREHLATNYKRFKEKAIYRDCIEYLDLLENMAYLKNPEGGLN